MKQAIVGLVIIVLLLLFALFVLYIRDAEEATVEVPAIDEETGQTVFERLQNATVRVPDTNIEVVLEKGAGSYADGPAQGLVSLADTYAENGDALVTIFVVNSGGSGTFYYLVLFENNGNELTQLDEAFLGDRIGVLGLLSDGEGTVSVDTLVRGDDEPFIVEPTILETLPFDISQGILKPVQF